MEYIVTKHNNFEIRHFPILDSTNEEAKRILRSAHIENTIIRADSQTAGKGRGGKEWVSEAGNLFFTIIINSVKEPEFIPYITAVSIARALEDSGLAPQIKWPNDILINNDKLGGILIEKGRDSLIIGIGVNIISFPQYLDNGRTATALQSHASTDPERLMLNILKYFNIILSEYKTSGFAPIREQLLKRLYKLNENVRLDYLGIQVEGTISGISEDGSLVVDTASGREEFRVGEIFAL